MDWFGGGCHYLSYSFSVVINDYNVIKREHANVFSFFITLILINSMAYKNNNKYCLATKWI